MARTTTTTTTADTDAYFIRLLIAQEAFFVSGGGDYERANSSKKGTYTLHSSCFIFVMTEKISFLNKMLPVLGDDVRSPCFRVTYALVLAGIVGLLVTAAVTGSGIYLTLAAGLLFSAFAGQIAPLYPVGILSIFLLILVPVLVVTSSPTASTVKSSAGIAAPHTTVKTSP